MAEQDLHLAQALGPRGADEVLAQVVQQAGTHIARQHPGQVRAQHEGGQQHRLDVGPRVLGEGRVARRRQDLEDHREQVDQGQRLEGGRQRDAHQAATRQPAVERAAALVGANHADGNAQAQGPQQAAEEQLQRHRRTLDEHVHHRLARAHRQAPVALHELAQPAPELLPGAAVLAVELAHGVQAAVVGRLAGGFDGCQQRVAGHQLHRRKRHHDHDAQHDGRVQAAGEQELQHRSADSGGNGGGHGRQAHPVLPGLPSANHSGWVNHQDSLCLRLPS